MDKEVWRHTHTVTDKDGVVRKVYLCQDTISDGMGGLFTKEEWDANESAAVWITSKGEWLVNDQPAKDVQLAQDLEDAKAAIAALDPRRVRNLIEAARRWRREWSAPGWGNPGAQQVAMIHLERSIDALEKTA